MRCFSNPYPVLERDAEKSVFQLCEVIDLSKLMTSSAGLCLGLVRDAFGNGWAGDAERSLRYLELAAKGLELHLELLKDRNNPLIEKKIREFHAGLETQLDSWPALDLSRAGESMKRFSEAGIKSILPKFDPSMLPGLPSDPKPGAHTVSLEGDDVRRFMAAVSS